MRERVDDEISGGGGRRTEMDSSPSTVWQNDTVRNDADYAMSEPSMAGFLKLLDPGHSARSAIMCAEAVWWRFHRRIIADHLIGRGESVMHILGRGWVDRARLSAAARPSPAELLIDDAQRSGTLPV